MDLRYDVLLVFVAFLLVLVFWKFWNFLKLYAEFPSYPLIPYLIISTVLRKIPMHIPYQGFVFQTLVQLSKRFQEEGMFLLWGPRPHLIIFGEEPVKIFSYNEAALDKPYIYDVMKDAFGTGMLTSHSEAWKKQRKIIGPAFHVELLKNKLHIFNENAEILAKKLTDSIRNPCIDVLEFIKPCAFGTVCEYILGLKVNSPENKELIHRCTDIIANGSKMLVYRFFNPWLHYSFMMNLTSSGRKFKKEVNEGHNYIKKMILETKEIISQERNKLNREDPRDNLETRKSFVRILLDQHLKDPSFTVDDLESQVITFMAAGYKTVAYTIMWCIFMLGLHPEVQDLAYNEVESTTKGYIKHEDLANLKYLECVIKETLRIYPTGIVYGRRTRKDIQCGKYKVPKGTSIIFFPYIQHRNPAVFPEPEVLKPDRFMDGHIENLYSSFTPFAEGIRYCIGKRFAMLEMKVVLAYILRHFRIRSLDRREDVDLTWEIVLAPVKPLRFQFTPRNRSSTQMKM